MSLEELAAYVREAAADRELTVADLASIGRSFVTAITGRAF